MKPETDHHELYQELANRFRVLGRFFADLGSPQGAERLVDALISDEGRGFNRLIASLDIPGIPPLSKCWWLRELIERSIVTPRLVEVCTLRDDLTPAERGVYLSIARRHGALILLTNAEMAIAVLGDGEGNPPGPFLDELKANGLVTCTTREKYDVTTTLGFGKPQRVCV